MRHGSRRLRAALAATAGTLLLTAPLTAVVTACAVGPDQLAEGRHPTEVTGADERMPIAPRGRDTWLAAVDRVYAHAGGGRSAESWLRERRAHRRPGERLAVLMGVDDVMLQTHFAGVDTLVPRSVRFVQEAHAMGYSVFYATNRTRATGLDQVRTILRRARVPMRGLYGRPAGAVDEESAKALTRATLERQGYTLAMVVAASGASFDGTHLPEHEVRLPDVALRA